MSLSNENEVGAAAPQPQQQQQQQQQDQPGFLLSRAALRAEYRLARDDLDFRRTSRVMELERQEIGSRFRLPRRSKRKREPIVRYSDGGIPGSNNGYTNGRLCDQPDRDDADTCSD